MGEREPEINIKLLEDENGKIREDLEMEIKLEQEIISFPISHFFLENMQEKIEQILSIRKEKLILKKQLNDYLLLKLEEGETNIYVYNPESEKFEKFRQCKYVVINIPAESVGEYDQIDSIDEAIEKNQISTELHGNKRKQQELISSEQEFFVHASNLQAWIENDYDTRILHRNMAFPLLKALAEAGEKKAMQKYKDEVAFRITSDHKQTFQFLEEQQHLKLFNENELYELSREVTNEYIKFKLLQKATQKDSFLGKEDYIDFLIDKINHDEEFREKNLNSTEYKRKKIFSILGSEDLIQISENLSTEKHKNLVLTMIQDKDNPKVRAIFLKTLIKNLQDDFSGFTKPSIKSFVNSKELTRYEIRSIALKLRDPIHKILLLTRDKQSIFYTFDQNYYEEDKENYDYGFRFPEFILTHLENPKFQDGYKKTQLINEEIKCKVVYKNFLDFGVRYLDRKVVYRLKYIHLAKKIFNQSETTRISIPEDKGHLKIFDKRYELQFLIEPEFFRI